MLAAALTFANSLADLKKRCPALAAIAAQQAALGQRETAVKTFDQSLDSARGIEDLYARSYAMGDLAEKLSAAGLHAKAQEVLAQAESVAARIPQPDLQQQALEMIRGLMGKLPRS